MYEEPQPYQYQAWPAWFYGPNGESDIFNAAEEVPVGWSDKPPGDEPAAPEQPEEPEIEPAPVKRGPGRPPKVTEEQF